jgi:glycosyltransferase involved in cell wall biosynthesis
MGADPHMSHEEIERLRALRGRFAGERIFIMGNGPSLNRMELELLAGEHVFAMNRISLLFPRISWRPDFFTAFDIRVVPDNLDEFNKLEIPYKFFATKHKGAILERENHYWHHSWQVSDDLEDRFGAFPEITGFGGGGTVACAAIQIAAYLGFDPIILIGCDAAYSVPTSVLQTGPDQFGDGVLLNLTSTDDDDANHFDPAYFGKGKRWHSPNPAEMHRGFEKCYRQMRRQGKALVNATVGGALECIPRVTFERLFVGGSAPSHRRTVGIDLTVPSARVAVGMRNSLMASLRNIPLLPHGYRFVAICRNDDSFEFYRPLQSLPSFDLIVDGSEGCHDTLETLDVLISPFNNIETKLRLPENVKRVAHLNDLIPLTQPNYSESLVTRYTAVAAGADAVVCLSEATRQEISRRFDIPDERIFVSPPTLDDELTVVPTDGQFIVTDDDISAARREVGVRSVYVIYPAAFRPHKNHQRLFEAMRYTYANLQLVLTAGERLDTAATEAMRTRIEQMQLGHRILVAANLATATYRALLKGAEAVVFPSLDEGFGIPVLEAQAMRVPVIASRRGGLVDVAEGALDIDPEDHRDIADKIVQLISDPELRESVAEAGWVNSRRFTKEWGARGLVDAIDFVLTESSPAQRRR